MKPALLIFAALLLTTKAIVEIRTPLDCDEKPLLSQGPDPRTEARTNFLHPSSHTLSHLFTQVSMGIGGIGPVTARIPAVVMAFAFLLLLTVFSRRYLSSLTAALLMLHFLTNENFNWYFHSARAYVYILFLCLSVLFLVFECLFRERKDFRMPVILLCVCFVLSVLNHTFSTLLFLLLIANAVAWCWVRRESLKPEQKIAFRKFLLVISIVTPLGLIIGGVAVWHYYKFGLFLSTSTGPHAGPAREYVLWDYPHAIANAFMGALGVFRNVWSHVLLVLVAALLWLGFPEIKKSDRLSYLWSFCALCFVTLMVVSFLFKPHAWSGRYLIPFSFLFILTCGETVAALPSRRIKYALAAAFAVLLVAVPLNESNPMIVTNLCESDYVFTSLAKRGASWLLAF